MRTYGLRTPLRQERRSNCGASQSGSVAGAVVTRRATMARIAEAATGTIDNVAINTTIQSRCALMNDTPPR